jgi:hypothetical protein
MFLEDAGVAKFRNSPQLFDLSNDPDEATDLAADPRCASIEARLRAVLSPKTLVRARRSARQSSWNAVKDGTPSLREATLASRRRPALALNLNDTSVQPNSAMGQKPKYARASPDVCFISADSTDHRNTF